MRNKKRITHKELLESGVVPWGSERTTKRRIQDSGFPAYKCKGKLSFVLDEVELWFRQKRLKPDAEVTKIRAKTLI